MSAQARPPEEAAARVWSFRARAELELSARFRQIVGDLQAVGAHSTVIDMTHEAAQDESRHARMCLELVAELTGEPAGAPSTQTLASPHVPGLTRAQTVTLQLVGMSCINETISTTALTEMLAETRGQRAHPVVHQILRDEVQHARVGWAHLGHIAARENLAFVSPYLPRLLSEAVRDELFTQSVEVEGLEAFGALPRSRRRAVLIQALEQIVLPGLERVGICTEPAVAWLQGRLAA